MLYAIAASATLIVVLAVPRSARARRRLARLLRAQEVWAELIDRESQPRQECPLAAPWRGPRKEDDLAILRAEEPPWPSCFLDSLMADAEPEMTDDIAP